MIIERLSRIFHVMTSSRFVHTYRISEMISLDTDINDYLFLATYTDIFHYSLEHDYIVKPIYRYQRYYTGFSFIKK